MDKVRMGIIVYGNMEIAHSITGEDAMNSLLLFLKFTNYYK